MSRPALAVEARRLNKIYAPSRKFPAKHALRDLSLSVPTGSIFGLLGPNGAGKSTFINMLAGLVTKTSGEVEVWGIDIDRAPRQARAAIGVVTQEVTMDPFFTPREALELQAGFYGVPAHERRTDDILEALGLADKKNAYVRQLSGGMKRRLMVGKAMVHNPPVLILDEPTAGVDVELRRALWSYVKDLHSRGTTIILTTHYLEEAQELCDTIAIINHGQVVACEPTPQLLRRLDTKTLVVRVAGGLTAVPGALSHLDARVRPDGALAVAFRQDQTGIMRLLDEVKSAGVEVEDLATEEPDLEDVFVALTSARKA
jgi:ABC-2 type transport system ATP-binding protein